MASLMWVDADHPVSHNKQTPTKIHPALPSTQQTLHIVFSEMLGTIRKKIVLADPGRSHALDIKL
jgi:hypothetical protein